MTEERKDFSVLKRHMKGSCLLSPLPTALVTVSDGEKDNIITVAWTGILSTHPPKTYIAVRPSRYSHEILEKNGEFVLHPCAEKYTKEVDFCGMFTGKKVDKFEKCHFTKEPSQEVKPPQIAELPLALECRVSEVHPMGTHDVFVADIVSVSVDDGLFDEKGKIRMEKAGLVSYVHGDYYGLGKRLGYFGFSAVKKKKKGAKHGTK